jgi:excisionase family DNA binding protein
VQVKTRPLLTVREAAARLSVNEKTVRRLIHSGSLPALKVGGSVRIDEAELEGELLEVRWSA